VYDKVIDALKGLSTKLDVKHRVLCSALDILMKSSRDDTDLKLKHPSEICGLVSDLWGYDQYRKVAQDFVDRFTDRE
jgi:hypothetical protein